MKIRAVVEYEVNPQDYSEIAGAAVISKEILKQERHRLIRLFSQGLEQSSWPKVTIKVEEVK